MPKDPSHTDFLSQAGWGVLTHYLSEIATGKDPCTQQEWNDVVGAFDVKGLADQLEAVGAGYYFITLGQLSGFYLGPNPTYDEIVGHQESHCSRRDLVADIYEELAPRGIHLLVYLPAHPAPKDARAVEAFEWGEYAAHWADGLHPWRKRPPSGADEEGRPWGSINPRVVNCQVKWEAIITDWSQRWGDKVRGWWFDGCYYPEMYEYPFPPNWSSFSAAARAGNPEAIVAFNPGVHLDMPICTEQQDYTAGEISEQFPPCANRWIHGVQWHVLSYLGEFWCAGEGPRFPDDFAISYTRQAMDMGGVVSWDVPILPSGLIPEPFLAQLQAIGEGVTDLRT